VKNVQPEIALIHLEDGCYHFLAPLFWALDGVHHIRAVLSEYGICLPQGVKVVSQRLPRILEDGENGLPGLTRHLLVELKAEHDQLMERVQRLEIPLKAWHGSSEQSQRLDEIPGIGVLTATTLAATITDGKGFRNVCRSTWFARQPDQAGDDYGRKHDAYSRQTGSRA
jgi:hypothetical protein